MRPKSLQLVAVGNAPAVLLKEFEDPIRAQLGLVLVTARAPLTAPTYAFNKDRGQYHASAILKRLAPLAEAGQSVLGLADVDLFVPDSPFVFGDADREARAGLVSLARLRQNAEGELLRRRIQIEGLHEAGHLVGLSYCEDSKCAMFLATSVSDCDRKQPVLCHLCRNEFAKLMR